MHRDDRGHRPRTPAAERSRRRFMNQALFAGGVAAVATMTGCSPHSSGTTASTSYGGPGGAMPSGMPSGGPGGSGGLDLVRVHAGNLDEGHAEVKTAEVEKHLDDTRISWSGETEVHRPPTEHQCESRTKQTETPRSATPSAR
ncbi:hypothetical protein U5640_01825 [Streptomyces sp. SS7]|uniref:hypothetical protein n=1 Tax=Streptomyces sp. SS7 TaxID=3108485 RepID=UPI0030EB36E8